MKVLIFTADDAFYSGLNEVEQMISHIIMPQCGIGIKTETMTFTSSFRLSDGLLLCQFVAVNYPG